MAQDLEVAILFADVVGSTQLYDKFGDTKASETVAHCLDIMKEATSSYNGTVIKTIGDEVMSTFPTVDEAMSAAAQMQQQISSGDGDIQVSIRVGCHYGPVVQEQNDIFGAAQEMCADLDGWKVVKVDEDALTITCEKANGLLGGTSTIEVKVDGPDGIPSSTTSVRSESKGGIFKNICFSTHILLFVL